MGTPTLTAVQQLVLANLLLSKENAELKLTAFIKDTAVPGYELQTNGTYAPRVESDGSA